MVRRSKQSHLSPFGCEVDWIRLAHLYPVRPKAKVRGPAMRRDNSRKPALVCIASCNLP